MKKYLKISYVIIYLFPLLAGCGSTHMRDFDLVNKSITIKPGTIAVVPGTLNDQDILIAKELTKHIKERSTYKVVPFKRVESIMPDYEHLLEEWGSPPSQDKQKNSYWLSNKNIMKVNWLQKKLNTKYIYLIWSSGIQRQVSVMHNQQGGNSTTVKYYIMIYGRMLEYPSSKIVGYSVNRYSGGDSSCMVISFFVTIKNLLKSEGDIINDFLEDSAEAIAKEIVRVTNERNKK